MTEAMPADHRLRLARGIDRLERYGHTEDRADLDEGIAAVATALRVLPADEPMVAYACLRLANSFWLRSELDDNAEDLDRAIVLGEATVAALGPGHPLWPVAHADLAVAHESRWRRDGEPTDLDNAIRSWRLAFDAVPSPEAAAYHCDLTRERSDLFPRDPRELDEAIALLERVLDGRFDGDPDLWLAWYALGRAQQRQAAARRLPDRLDAALDSFDRALRSGIPAGDSLLNLHLDRLGLVSLAMVAFPGARSRVMAQARAILGAAGAAGESHGAAASPLLRTQLAGSLAALIITLDVEDVVPPTGWDMVTLMMDYMRDTGGVGASGDALAGWIAGFLDGDGLGAWDRRTLQGILAELLHTQASRRGELHGRHRASQMLRDVGPTDPVTALIGTVHQAFHHAELGNLDRFRELAATAEQDFAALANSYGRYGWVASLVDSLRAASAMLDAPGPETAGRETPGDLPDSLTSWEARQAFLKGLTRYGRCLVHPDPAELRAYGQFLTRLVQSTTTGHERFASLKVAANVFLLLATIGPPDPTAARTAATHFEQALAIAGGPAHPDWAGLAVGLGESLRLVSPAHHARARELGRSGLHGLALHVFLQAGTDDAIRAAQRGSDLAAKVAGWCLADEADEDLFAVLNASRGLVLAAATTSRDVARRLTETGRESLAAEWLATSGYGRDRFTGAPMSTGAGEFGITDDLRTLVVRALYADNPDAVRVAEVQEALQALAADALVYLVPSGHAVILPAHGDLEAIALPDLAVAPVAVGPETVVGRWVAASSGLRDLGPLPTRDESGALDSICAWAWTACVGRLVERTQPRRRDRPARVVLVPMGALGLVPWHAAFTTGADGHRRYAVEDIAFSYTISARVLCTSARHPLRSVESALVIGNPGGDLPFAGVEAAAVHRTFYPDGTYLERSATPTRVREWLTNATGPALLHLACHATTDPRSPADAHLVLAGRATLSARDLIEACRDAALPIDRVFLAACATNVTGIHHDEAFSLATAFLAAGAHTVFGTLWPVRDEETSLFMYLVHHHLNVDGLAPSDALHRAQRWMLDPQRQPPPGMPIELATRCRNDALALPIAWAGFTHLGR